MSFVVGLLFFATSVTSRAAKPSLAGVGFGLAMTGLSNRWRLQLLR